MQVGLGLEPELASAAFTIEFDGLREHCGFWKGRDPAEVAMEFGRRHSLDSRKIEKLRQALVVTSKLGLPNPIRTAAVCSCFDRVASLFHRYEGLLRTLRGELLRSIYVDYRPGAVNVSKLPTFTSSTRATTPIRRVRKQHSRRFRVYQGNGELPFLGKCWNSATRVIVSIAS